MLMVLRVSAGRMVGRDDELGRLLSLLDDAGAGRSVAALVSGDAGVGKSRLVREPRSATACPTCP
jgi:predicted ATPase